MKFARLLLFVLVAAPGVAFAQDEERRAPPIEIPDFSNLDEYIYEPKSVVTLGFRYLSGARTRFSGKGSIPRPNDPGEAVGANLTRVYHDGAVRPDARTVARLDSSGNPIIDPQTNTAAFDPVAPDGRTNTWNYTDARQLSLPGFVRFSTYSAELVDPRVREAKGGATAGMDLAVARDMGKLLGGRFAWSLVAGVSINDLSSSRGDFVRARISTLSDYFSLYGQVPPDAPYSSPSTTTENVVDAVGNTVLGPDGTAQTLSVDTSVLLGSEPAGRVTSETEDETSVQSRSKLKGAFYTFRAGPSVSLAITPRFRASVSAGAAMVFAGTSYTVTQTLKPEAGAEISNTTSSDAYKLLPGYFADASLHFDLTERSGVFAGAVFQSSGSYTHALEKAEARYSGKVDLSNQSGVRAGLSVRF